MQAQITDDVKDENPVWLDSGKISKYRSHVARCLFFSQDRADISFAVNELCQRKVRFFTTQFQSMMRDLGFAVKSVLIIDAKATEHILHRHGIGKMKQIDVAHLWLQDEVKSKRLRARRVKSENNLADVGTNALSSKITRKRATSMEYTDAQKNLKSGNAIGLWAGKLEQAGSEQSSSAENVIGINWCPCWKSAAAVARAAKSRRGRTKRGNSKPDASIMWSVSTQADYHGQLQSFTRRFLDELFGGQHEVFGK